MEARLKGKIVLLKGIVCKPYGPPSKFKDSYIDEIVTLSLSHQQKIQANSVEEAPSCW